MIWTGREETSWGFQYGEQIAPGLIALERLGGSEYESYLAADETSGRSVVAKLVRPHMVEETYPLRGLERELRILEEVAHPGIVRLIRADLGAQRPHLVLTHCAGRSLADLVAADGPLGVNEATDVARWLAGVIAYLTDRGIVHLDIKPHNIISGAERRLIDFGIARTVQDAAQLKSPTGTDAYMAPEQCHPAETTVGPAADVWGFGATALFGLTGAPPFPRVSGAPTGQAGRWPQLSRTVEIPDSVPKPLASLIRACLATEPAARPTIHEVLAALEHT